MKRELFEIFIDEIHIKPPMRNYPSNNLFYSHIDETWGIDLADMIDYKISNNKVYRYIFTIVDFFNEFTWAISLKNKNAQKKKKNFQIF